MENKIYYYLYQITNNLNGKIYVGVHKTANLDDGYMGSGKVIRSAIEKYGIENFTKVILEQFEDAAAMYTREKEVVTDEFLLREDTYNLRRGGTGGFDFLIKTNQRYCGGMKSSTSIEKMKNSLSTYYESDDGKKSRADRSRWMKEHSPSKNSETASKISAAHTGRPKSLEHKARIRESLIGKNSGPGWLVGKTGNLHPSYGTMWITNGTESNKVPKDFILPDGWVKGRVMKKVL